jgi:choloylglycine hydrolase
MENFHRHAVFFLLMLSLAAHHTALACTRILHANKTQAVMVGRTMDWSEDMHTQLFVYPAGIFHKGTNDARPLLWTSRYGSIVAAVYQNITTDGLNERGLATHILELKEADYGKRNTSLPGIDVTQWAQFYLDNFASVNEAIQYAESHPFQIVAVSMPQTNGAVSLHLALEDASGDSAIIEYINGKPITYHHQSYITLTNSPIHPKQLKNLLNYSGFGGVKRLPGTSSAKDRFVRATYYTQRLPTENSVQAELFNVLAVLRNISQVRSLSGENKETAWTLWRTVCDLTHRVYYFDDAERIGLVWVKLGSVDLSSGAPVMKFDLQKYHEETSDVSGKFETV